MTLLEQPSAAVASAGLRGAADLYGTALRGTRDYWRAAGRRHATPSDLLAEALTWTRATSSRRRPQWSSPHRVVREWPVARLRDFSGSDDGGAGPHLPLLLLPPQAGHDSCIVDYAPDQSQVRTARQAGLARIFSLDWKPATAATATAGIDDYLAAVDQAVEEVGGRVHLVGDCQGGWLATIYAALHPDRVATLTIAGAPVDFHAGEPAIQEWMRFLSPRGELALYRAAVRAHGGVLPGDFLLAGFKAMQPGASLERKLDLLVNVREERRIERHQRFEDWFNHTQPVPGTFYLWIVEHLFLRNELVRGELEIGGAPVRLNRITMPLNLLAGAADHITPAPQVFALADHAGTPEELVARYTAPGGHLGLFMGRAALGTQWAPIFASLAASAPEGPPEQPSEGH
jgi:poly(3-hydroxyalkanoate) synthetase